MSMFKVKLKYYEGNPQGGSGRWYEVLKLYDAVSSSELQEKIDKFLLDDKCGYRELIQLIDVERV